MNGQQATILLTASVILILPIGALIGAIVGFLSRRRKGGNEPHRAALLSQPP